MRKSTIQYKMYVKCNLLVCSSKHFCHGKAIMLSLHSVELNMLLSTTYNHGKCCHEEGTKHCLFIVDPYAASNNIKLWSHVMATQQWVALHYYRATKYFVMLSIIRMYIILLVMYQEDLSDFQQIWDFSKTKCQEKFVQWEPSPYIRTDGRTDRQTRG